MMGPGARIITTAKKNAARGSVARGDMLREMLLERRRRLRAEIDECSRNIREEERPDSWDEADRAIHGFDQELRSARLDRLLRMLQQTEEALLRHAEGLYGRCTACGVEIPLARLRSLPFALYCRDCQEANEQRVIPPRI